MSLFLAALFSLLAQVPGHQQGSTRSPRLPRGDPPITIHSLPPEILRIISNYIPNSGRVSLKLASRTLYHAIPIPPDHDLSTTTYCEKLAIRRAIHERKHTLQNRRQCLGCNTLQHTHYFHHPHIPICAFEDCLLTSLVIPPHLPDVLRRRLAFISKRIAQPRWVRITRVWCAHDRHLIGWHVPACNCHCDSCAHLPVTCLVRLSRRLQVPRSWSLCRDEVTGREMMEEEAWLPTADGRRDDGAWTDGRAGPGCEPKSLTPVVSMDQAEAEIDLLEISHQSLLTLS